MSEDLHKRLRQLGVVRGVRELAALSSRRRVAIENLIPGRFHTTSQGRCFVVEQSYPLDHHHGELPLSALADLPQSQTSRVLADVGGDPAVGDANLARACFLDTETTGLSGGTGTMAFVVGLGYLTDTGFCTRQFFLRDPGDEPAMIEALAELLPTFEVVVSFNGRGFDVPILENRFILARRRPPTIGMPHLDLLIPARRLWRYSLNSCRLGALEQEVLGILREQDDVPSGIIPYLYRDYLLTGDARDMKRVIYHNGIDILSLVVLAARLCRAFTDPWDGPVLTGGELYGVGRWYAAEGRLAEAERAYRTALAAPLAPELRAKALSDLGQLLKRDGRHKEAFTWWQQLALTATPDRSEHIQARVELAKYYEWHLADIELAAGWARAALDAAGGWPCNLSGELAPEQLQHRLKRLHRKLDRSAGGSDTEGE